LDFSSFTAKKRWYRKAMTRTRPKPKMREQKPSPATILYSREGLQALRRSAEQGYSDALVVLALLLLGGSDDVEKDQKEGARLIYSAQLN
jgi:hypothetical protein